MLVVSAVGIGVIPHEADTKTTRPRRDEMQKPRDLAVLQSMLRARVTASELSDAQFIGPLRQPPKALPYIRTEDAYRKYFADVKVERLQKLLPIHKPSRIIENP